MSAILDAEIRLKDELLYSFNSTDNERQYEAEFEIEDSMLSVTIFGLIVQGVPKWVVGAPSGATMIHEHTWLRDGDDVLIAIGSYVCSYSLIRSEMNWHLEVDQATCFGIYHAPDRDAFLSHGELSITRFTRSGSILWQSGGADILCDFRLDPAFVEVVDFKENVYQFDYADGRELHAGRKGAGWLPVVPSAPLTPNSTGI